MRTTTERRVKSANPTAAAPAPAAEGAHPAQVARAASTHADALQKLFFLALAGAGAGATARAVGGIASGLGSADVKPGVAVKPMVIDVRNLTRSPSPDAPARKRRGTEEGEIKLAQTPATPPPEQPAQIGPGLASRGLGFLENRVLSPINPYASNGWEQSYTYPLGALALLAGGWGGYQALDTALDNHHQRQSEGALEEARRRYQRAMTAQFDRPKLAASNRAGAALDALAALAEKQADFPALDQAKALYMTAAALAAAGTGLGTYRYMRDRDPDALLEKAVKERERQRLASRPPQIYLRMRSQESAPLESHESQALPVRS